MDTAHAFTNRLATLLRDERAALADFIVALEEFDRERLWLTLGYASLFDFLHRELGLSRGAAHYRKTAAWLVRDFPEIVEPIRRGHLCFSSIVELSKVLTPENRAEVLPRFFNVSKLEAKAVAVEISPAAVVPTRSVVTPVHLDEPALHRDQVAVHPDEPARVAAPPPSVTPPAAPPLRATIEPLTPELARIHVTVSARVAKKIAAAREALSHAKPGATDGDVLEAALDLLLAQAEKRKGLTDKPLKTPRSTKTSRIPAHVRRAVWKRDGGCCSWKLESGGVCGSRQRVQFDHVVPEALGGPSTIENVRLLCDVHNEYAARLVFGDALMDRYAAKARRPRVGKRADHPHPGQAP